MKKKTNTKHDDDSKKPASSQKKGVGAHGSREKPKGDGGPKWPGGGKKGEDE